MGDHYIKKIRLKLFYIISIHVNQHYVDFVEHSSF